MGSCPSHDADELPQTKIDTFVEEKRKQKFLKLRTLLFYNLLTWRKKRILRILTAAGNSCLVTPFLKLQLLRIFLNKPSGLSFKKNCQSCELLVNLVLLLSQLPQLQ